MREIDESVMMMRNDKKNHSTLNKIKCILLINIYNFFPLRFKVTKGSLKHYNGYLGRRAEKKGKNIEDVRSSWRWLAEF